MKIKKFNKFLESNNLDTYEIDIKGYPLIVLAEYTQGEEPVMYSNDGGFPGVSDDVNIVQVYAEDEGGKNIEADEDYLSELGISYDDIENAILDQIKN